ncbi:hypothetical protein TeGR_g14584 [Tetraparma gracilis]|uniref:Uncharacterized protein n=1 Tax=Tetraparma gracilis TaxID=2962635 RepID=A0ABQ6MPI1_9STRA|nr:hypothetical protein TeGR_g14584 [Tetraparma gracilis]
MSAQIKTTELALRNGILEDGPSFILNLVALILQFESGTFSSANFYTSLISLLISCATGGRKTTMREKLKLLRERKRVLEEGLDAVTGGSFKIKKSVASDKVTIEIEGGKEDGGRAVADVASRSANRGRNQIVPVTN